MLVQEEEKEVHDGEGDVPTATPVPDVVGKKLPDTCCCRSAADCADCVGTGGSGLR